MMKHLIRSMKLLVTIITLLAAGSQQTRADHHEQIVALVQYHIADAEQHNKVDKFLETSYVPALKRQGIPSVGVFEAHNKDKDGHSIWILASFESLEQYMGVSAKLVQDGLFLETASEYLSLETKNDRAFERIEVTLMRAFSGWPATKNPGEDKKLFELRNYESFSEYKGYMKVAMFNNGEIDIFNKTGLHGVFFGDVIAGKDMPNLVYMLGFKDMEERDSNWKKFVNHPDWKAMADMEEYKQTVSKIHQTFLVEKPYSRL